MTDYKKYLKTALVGDGKIITYRQLSRELKVHVNVAKEMLYDFHHDLNLRKPSSCHATYVLSGTQKTSGDPGSKKDAEGDEVMGSSPFDVSQVSTSSFVGNRDGKGKGTEKSVVKSIVLVGEEKLEEVKKSFEVLSSIHVYSIEPAPLSDMLLLADNSLAVMRLDAAVSSPQDTARKYGSIMNPHAKRRTGVQAILPALAPARASASASASAAATKQTTGVPTKAPEKKIIFGRKPTTGVAISTATATPSSGNASATAQAKRAQADFFKAFGGKKTEKAKKEETGSSSPVGSSAKSKIEKTSPTTKSTPTASKKTPNISQQFTGEAKKEGVRMDVDMADADDDEEGEEENKRKEVHRLSDDEDENENEEQEEDDPEISPPPTKKKRTTRASISAANAEHAKRKAERSAQLRAMMMDDDEEDAIPPSAQPQLPSSSPPAGDEIPPSVQPLPITTSSPIATPTTPQLPARRRGRRKVNKRTTTRDKEGYLVTQNEIVWESFSEDEPEPTAIKSTPVIPLSASTSSAAIKKEKKGGEGEEAGKKKKAGGAAGGQKKGGQGSITSFFGRK